MNGTNIGGVALAMTDADTVVTALDDLDRGTTLELGGGESVCLVEDVPFGHKVATQSIAAGEPIYKYGEVIGTAISDVRAGEWVHTHNCESTRGRGDLSDEDLPKGDEVTESSTNDDEPGEGSAHGDDQGVGSTDGGEQS